jgi:hypothetical protein
MLEEGKSGLTQEKHSILVLVPMRLYLDNNKVVVGMEAMQMNPKQQDIQRPHLMQKRLWGSRNSNRRHNLSHRLVLPALAAINLLHPAILRKTLLV